jgi:hypothetical protein
MGPWMIFQLKQQKQIQPLSGFGYAGVVIIKAKRMELLALLRKGLRAFPPVSRPVEWPEVCLTKTPRNPSGNPD